MAESPFSDDLDLDFMNWASGLTPAESPTDALWGELEDLLADPSPGELVDSGADLGTDMTGESKLPPPSVESLFAEPEVAPPEVTESSDMWGELEGFFADPMPQKSVDLGADLDTDMTGESELPPSNVEFLFGEPEVAPVPSVMPVSPSRELTLPPLISPQGLWAEIGHLFQTPAFSEAAPAHPASPAIESEIDMLSQAMLANDGDTIQTLVQQIQQTYDELKSIEIFLAATRNLCC